MKIKPVLILFVIFQGGLVQWTFSQGEFSRQGPPKTWLFDEKWRFFRGGAEGAELPGFDDRGWREIDLPHDWSIEDIAGTASPFSPGAISQVGGGFTVGGTGWYRKTFVIPAEDSGKRILILFEGIYMNADIWLNGHRLGNHPYGYTSFWYDLTAHVKFGNKNILSIQVKNEGANSRWYSGSGITRHVWLKVLNPVHIPVWGISITTPDVNAARANVVIETKIEKKSWEQYIPDRSPVMVITKILDPGGREVARNSDDGLQKLVVARPMLWSPDSPDLYTAITLVYWEHRLTDSAETKFGIRSITFDAKQGMLLNGKPLKLKGGCYHNDNGPLGARSYDRAEERRVRLLKSAGFNAIRCSHNPPPPAFLEACDRLGMLVIDEAFDMWQEGKSPYDYHLYFRDHWRDDLESMVLRDRNHPSVFMWSVGNEIPNLDKPAVTDIARLLVGYVRGLDSARAVTAAVNLMGAQMDTVFSFFDVAGYNYGKDNYDRDHGRAPGRVMMATESYPLEAFDYWMAVTDHPYLIGDFVWTAFDYIGEASIGWRGFYHDKEFYPWSLAYCGDIDICGHKRPQSYYRDALWKQDALSVFIRSPTPSFPLNPHIETWSKWNWEDVLDDWTWKDMDGKMMEVVVYSSCDTAELFLNNKSLGNKKTDRASKFRAVWQVPYQKGILKAAGYRDGRQVASSVIQSADTPVRLFLSEEDDQPFAESKEDENYPGREDDRLTANGEYLHYVNVELQDQHGIINPKAEDLIRFTIQGKASIEAVGNGNPVSLESSQRAERKAWRGRCMVIVRSPKRAGAIRLTASAAGMRPITILLR